MLFEAKNKVKGALAMGQRMGKNKKGKVSQGEIVALVTASVLLAALGPTIFSQLSGFANDSSLSTAEKAIAGVLGIFVMVGFLTAYTRKK